MRIWAFSDLHLQLSEIERDDIFPIIPEADLCIVAGDLAGGEIARSMDWLGRTVRRRMPAIFVPGNHEFYRTSIPEALLAGRLAAALNGIEFLHDAAITMGDVRIFGTTLWGDFGLNARGDGVERGRAMAYAASAIADYELIRPYQDRWKRWTPLMSLQQHMSSRIALERELERAREPVIVVSHHAPHPRSLSPEFAKSPLAPAFASDLSEIIEQHRPSLWIHGHTHFAVDYRIGGTRIVCNPRGHHHENTGFDPGKVVEVQSGRCV